MTNQLLLAQVLATGFENVLTPNSFWPVFIGSLLTLASPYLVAWWNGRKADKQMDLSKRSAPPELTLYKTWLEVSEKYKELYGVKDVKELKNSDEYQEIEASRKVALERAVWERKVISECPNVQAQKRLMQLPESKIYEIYNPDKAEEVELGADSYVRPKALEILWVIPLLLSSSYFFIIKSISGGSSSETLFAFGFSFVLFIVMFPLYLHVFANQYSGNLEANYYLRKIRSQIILKSFEAQGVVVKRNIFAVGDKHWESWCRKENLRYALFFGEWEKIVYCPWENEKYIKKNMHKIRCYFSPGSYVKLGFEGSTLWGSYKEENLNVDLNQKNKESSSELHRNKDAQSPDSGIPEKSQPAPPQG